MLQSELRRWVRNPATLARRGLDAVYLVPDHDPVALEGSAVAIWELLDEPLTRGELVDAASLAFGQGVDQIRADVGATLDRLVDAGAVVDAADLGAATRDAPPAVPVAAITGAADAVDPLVALARWSLPGVPFTPHAVDDATWPAVRYGIRRERLTGLAVGAVRAGDLRLDAAARAQLADDHRTAMLAALRLERLLLEVLSALGGEGIEPIVIKGPSIAHIRYPDPSMRQFGDIDLLIQPDQLDRAFELLTGAGLERRYPQPRSGFDRRWGKGAAFVSPGGLEIDAHRSFAAGPFGITVRLDDAWEAPEHFSLGGRRVAMLAGPAALVSVAMHAVLGSRLSRLLNLRDIAQLALAVDLDAARHLATRWEVDAPFAEAVRRTSVVLGLGDGLPLAAWARDHEGPRRQRRALAVYTSPHRSYARLSLAGLRVVPGWRGRAAYLRAMVLPDRSYVAGRDGSRGRRWLRMVRVIARR